MRTILVILALVIGTQPAVAVDATFPPEASQEPSTTAPATVLKHQVSVTVDASGRSTTTTTWQVRIEDPAACAAGLIAPQGLDGATDGAATVLEETLLIGPDARPGTVYSLSNTIRSTGLGSQSGGFLTAPDLPTERASFRLRAPGYRPLQLWHDRDARPRFRSGSVDIEWTSVSGDSPAEVVWSTHENWVGAGTTLRDRVNSLLATKTELGREISDGYTGMHLGEASERVAWAIELDPNGSKDWGKARDATRVLADKRGGPVDRGVVLLSLLKLAGYDAEPGYFRAADARGTFPMAIPAPAMLGQPVVVIHREGGDAYIDPANDAIAVPELPSAIRGGVTWVPGDLPAPFVSNELLDGQVDVVGSIIVSADGSARWTAEITATGAASEAMRKLLTPLSEQARSDALERLVRSSRPELERFSFQGNGIEKTRDRFEIRLGGFDSALLEPVGAGLLGEIPAVLAPSMAVWLPPNIQIKETMSVTVPQSVQIVAAAPPESAHNESALLARRTVRNGPRMNLVTEVTRPYRVSTAGRDNASREFLEQQALRGVRTMLHAPASKEAIAALRTAPFDPLEKVVLEALLWWRQRLGNKASKLFRTAVADFGGERTAQILGEFTGSERRPWELLASAAKVKGTGEDRLAVASTAAANGLTRLAWRNCYEIAAEEKFDPSVRAGALLLQAQIQPATRPEPSDKVGNELWVEPDTLLGKAEALTGPDDTRLILARAQRAIHDANWSTATQLLGRIEDGGPLVDALHAQAMAETGAPIGDVRDLMVAALRAAPHDAGVLGSAAAVHSRLGLHGAARDYALFAARLDRTNPDRWSAVVPIALAAGDLPTAGQAASYALELDRKNLDRAATLALVSAMLHDDEGWQHARTVNPSALPEVTVFPPPLAKLVQITPPEGLLALLQQHDAEVVADPNLLAIRGQMRLDAGLLDEAARDGVLLDSRHSAGDGIALATAATAGRMYSTTWKQRLDSAASNSVRARNTRMEAALITGSSDPTSDAAKLPDDPRAQVIARLRSDPKGLASEVPDWPVDAKSPWFTAPSGYRSNSRLGASPGVTAVSNRDESTAILRLADTSDVLPAPLHQLYTPGDQVLTKAEVGTVVRMDGGPLPLFMASAVVDGETPHRVLALGFSAEAAGRALTLALE